MNIDNRFFKTPANNIKFLETQIFLGVGRISDLNFSNEKNKNYGFSLIELIVVVAIMAVMVVVLAPSLLMYNERSRAEKDNASMDELVNAVQLALADSEVYDEVLRFSTVDNVSCYVDTNSESNYSRIVTKANPDGIDQYTFLSDARTLDETPYFAAGNMRGVTLTFAPNKGSNGSTFDLKQGVVNQYIQVSNNQRIGAMPKLYNAVRSTIGDTIVSDSQTYRNSEYTIFVRLGTTGGNDASQQDAIQAYGQWSGTNLPAQVSYQIVSDRTVGDTGNTIVDIDDNNWNETNGNKITLKPGDLNGGGSFTPGTETGNKDYYTKDDFAEDEKGMYAYLINDNALVLRNSPREDLSDVTKSYGIINGGYFPAWYLDGNYNKVTYVDIETPVMLPADSRYLFNCLENCTEIKNQKNMCFDQCVVLEGMFRRCYKLTKLDSAHWNLSNVTTTYDMFSGCYTLKELDVSKWDVSNIRSMTRTFHDCTSLTELNVSNWNFCESANLTGLFQNCKNITKLDVSGWDMSHVKTIKDMFANCQSLEKLDVSRWDTSNLSDIRCFYGCKSLKSLDLSQWNISGTTNLSGLFNGCQSLEEIKIETWNTNHITNMGGIFNSCYALEYIDLSNWDTSSVTNMGGMFWLCRKLKSIGDVSGWDVSNVTNMEGMFHPCNSLRNLDIENWDVSSVTNMNNMLKDCPAPKPSWYVE